MSWLLFVVPAALLAAAALVRARNRPSEKRHRDSLDALARVHTNRRAHRG